MERKGTAVLQNPKHVYIIVLCHFYLYISILEYVHTYLFKEKPPLNRVVLFTHFSSVRVVRVGGHLPSAMNQRAQRTCKRREIPNHPKEHRYKPSSAYAPIGFPLKSK